MPDQRSVLKEYRSLEQKRASEGLTPAEAARHAALRDLIGPETGAGGLGGGFDVSAAAARLRESLLPAGLLRNRPPPPPVEPAAPPEPAPAEPELSPSDALAGAWAAEPFAPVEPSASDALYDPASLGLDAVPASDDGVVAAEWDQNAGQEVSTAYDASAAAYDASAAAYDPSAPYDPAAAAYDPAAQGQPAEAQPGMEGWDPGAQAYVAPGHRASADAADAHADQDYGASTENAHAEQGYGASAGAADYAEPGCGTTPAAAGAYGDQAHAAWGDATGEPTLAGDAAAEQPWGPGAALDPEAPAPEPAWDAAGFEASASDAGVAAYDGDAGEAAQSFAADAAAGYDATGGGRHAPGAWDAGAPLDPNAGAWDAGAPLDPNAGAWADPSFDPNAPPAWDASQTIGPGAPYPGAPSGAGEDAAAPVDPAAPPTWDASQPFDPNAPYPAAPYDPAAASPGVNEEPGWAAAAAGEGLALPAWAPVAQADDPGASLGEPSPDAGAVPFRADAGALPPEGWDLSAPPPDTAPVDAPRGEYDETGGAALPVGEDAGLESMLPFDPSAPHPGGEELPEPYGAPGLGEYDDTAGFSGGAFPDAAPADLPAEGGGFEAARAVAPAASEGWHPEPAVDDGFLLESGGSFDAAAAAVAPEWAVGGEPPWAAGSAGTVEPTTDAEPAFVEAEMIELQPEVEPPADDGRLDLSGATEPALGTIDVDISDDGAFGAQPPAAEAAAPEGAGLVAAPDLAPEESELSAPEPPAQELGGPGLDLSRPDLSEGGAESALAPLAVPVHDRSAEEEEIIDGEEILEEIVEEVPPDAVAPAASPPLDFEPLVVAAPAAAGPAPAPAAPIVPAPPPLVSTVPAAPRVSQAAPSAPPPATAPAATTTPAAAIPAPPARPVPPAAVAPPPAPAPPRPEPTRRVEGVHRVVVHTLEGQVKRGVLEDPDLAAEALALAPQPGGAVEVIGAEKVKAIFFMLAPGERSPAPEGRKVRVTFRDGRQIAGFSPDYDGAGAGFFMIPADTRTNTGRIWVYRASVKQVAVS